MNTLPESWTARLFNFPCQISASKLLLFALCMWIPPIIAKLFRTEGNALDSDTVAAASLAFSVIAAVSSILCVLRFQYWLSQKSSKAWKFCFCALLPIGLVTASYIRHPEHFRESIALFAPIFITILTLCTIGIALGTTLAILDWRHQKRNEALQASKSADSGS